jgi:tetrahydromethanopterin S-methyltransferase subunit G
MTLFWVQFISLSTAFNNISFDMSDNFKITPFIIEELFRLIKSIDNKIDNLSNESSQSFFKVNEKIEKMNADTNQRFDDTNQRIDDTNQRIDDTNQRIEKMNADTNQRIDDTNQRIEKMNADTNRRFDDTNQRIDDTNQRIEKMNADTNRRIDVVIENLSELLTSTQTPLSAELVDSCARNAVFHINYSSSDKSIFISDNKSKVHHCSAFAYQPYPSKQAVIVTAAHCFSSFYNKTPFNITIASLGDKTRHACTVLEFFSSPEDASILLCPTLIITTVLVSSARTRLSQMVAITGFAEDAFRTSSTVDGFVSHHLTSSDVGLPTFALNVDFARIVNIAGPLRKRQDGTACVSSANDTVWPVIPSGFVDHRVTEGMSGGPILDLKCGVVGIAHGRTCNAGVFMSLSVVDQYIFNHISLISEVISNGNVEIKIED